MLQRLGVEEAELWLCPELESWNSLTKHKPNQHHGLRDMASHWLLTWTRKYKVWSRYQIYRDLCGNQMFFSFELFSYCASQVHSGSRSEGIQRVFAPVEVLKYFCSLQKGKQSRPPPPEGRKDAVIVPSDLSRFVILIQGLSLSFGFVCCIFFLWAYLRFKSIANFSQEPYVQIRSFFPSLFRNKINKCLKKTATFVFNLKMYPHIKILNASVFK